MPTTLPPSTAPSGQLVATDGRTLPLVAQTLAVTAGGGLARTRLVQRFTNRHQEPLTVTYQLPLPADGAVAAFAFCIGARRIDGEIDRRTAARERFERALADGRSAALLEQDRSALFQQQIGNIPPGAEVVAELTVDQPLAWCAGGEWEYRFPTTVAPRYLGAEGRVGDAARIAVDVAQDPLPPRLCLELDIDDHLADGATPSSPSHPLRCEPATPRHVGLADGGVRLDRDVVVRWRVADTAVGTALATARPAAADADAGVAYGLLSLVPPAGAAPTLPRDLTVLLDTSGSMDGAPLQQAKAVVDALIESLTADDQLQMIEFSDAPRRWQRAPAFASPAVRRQAQQWLAGLQAGGGTEMRDAVLASLRALRGDAQSQVLLITDGLVGFEREIVQALLQRLPRNCRFHVLGVGSAPNRSLSAACARAGRGVEAFAGLDEPPAAAAQKLVAAMRAPVVVDLRLSGSALLGTAPAQLPDLFAGAPARLSLRLRPEGGALRIDGMSAAGAFARELRVPAVPAASGRAEIVTRCGRELVEDLEMRVAAGDATADCERQIEALGLQFRLATRFTSWVAIASEPAVDPTAPVRRERMPHDLPYGMSVEGLGLRTATPGATQGSMTECFMAKLAAPQATPRAKGRTGGIVRRMLDRLQRYDAPEAAAPPPRRTATLVFQALDCLRLEFDAGGGAWSLPGTVQLCWSDGTTLQVRVVAARSTRSGSVPAGARVVLHLELPAGAPQQAPAFLVLAGERIAVVQP